MPCPSARGGLAFDKNGRVITPSRPGALDTEIAYAAGFFDGEGSIVIARQCRGLVARRQHQLVISVSQMRNRWPLDTLARLFGGTVSQHTRGEYRWRVVSGKAAEALDQMLPYLLVKRGQAVAALDFQRRRIGRSGTTRTEEEYQADEDAYWDLRNLKKVVEG